MHGNLLMTSLLLKLADYLRDMTDNVHCNALNEINELSLLFCIARI